MPMKLIHDAAFRYAGYHGVPSECHLLVYRAADGAAVAIASEVKTNAGTSIANIPARVAAEAVRVLALDPARLIWVERFTDPPPRPGERLMILEFPAAWPLSLVGRVHRTPTTAADVARLVGRKDLPPPPMPSY